MSNLSDLLPAGAAAKQLTFTDSGSGISSKAPVVLNSDGTVSGISSTAAVTGAAATFESATTNETATIYDSNSNKVVVFYRDDGNSYYLTAAVGTITGGSTNTVSWGTPVVVASVGVNAIAPVFQSSDNQIVVSFHDWNAGSRIKVISGEVSGTSTNWSSAGPQEPDGTHATDYTSSAFDANAGKTVTAWKKNDNSTGAYSVESIVITVSGTGTGSTVSFGSISQVDNGGDIYDTSCVYDSNANKVLVTFGKSYDSYKGFGRVGTVSGTSISYGTEAQFMTGKQPLQVGTAFDTSANKIVITGGDNANSSQGDCCLGTISGTDITYSTPVVFSTGNGSGVGNYSKSPIATVYNPDTNKTLIAFFNIGDDYSGQYVEGTVSGSTISFGSATTFEAAVSGQISANYISAAYDTNVDRFLIAFVPYATGPYYGQGRVIQVGSTNLTAQAFVGVADSAISASAAGSVIVQGGTVSGTTADVSIAESLSSAFLYAQDGAADPVGSKAAGTGSDNFLIAYEVNDGVARGALAQAATVTSGNISYGSSATIGGASTAVYNYSIAYDSTNDKFVVFWQNQSTGYIYGAVVTLTGNSISYGAETAVYSAAGATGYGRFSSTYDPDTDRVILGLCDNSDTYAYSVVIELGTTTIDTVGTPQKIDSASATVGYGNRIALCYDTTENKVIATYINAGGGGSYYLRVAAGTVTGASTNSISWGSSSVVYSGDAGYPSIAYNATDQRVVIVYKQVADGKGYSSVATVSGTTVTANTPSLMYDGSGTLYYTSLAHDAYVNKMVVHMRAYWGEAVNGAIDTSANSITWSTPLAVDSNAYNPPQVVFNASTNQTILSAAGTTKATAKSFIYTVPGTISGQPLTVGTKYYVTTSGGFSSSADTPSVNAGIAISTTSLLLNGDS